MEQDWGATTCPVPAHPHETGTFSEQFKEAPQPAALAHTDGQACAAVCPDAHRRALTGFAPLPKLQLQSHDHMESGLTVVDGSEQTLL